MGSSELICFEIYFSIKFVHSALYVYSNDENMIIYNSESETNIKKNCTNFQIVQVHSDEPVWVITQNSSIQNSPGNLIVH